MENRIFSYFCLDVHLLYFQMGPKKAKTRHSVMSLSYFGPPVSLPDIGSLYTLKDILAAVEMLRVSNPENTNWWCCRQVLPKVRAKWVETNPLLVLIQDESILSKITRSYETALLINQNKAKVKAKQTERTWRTESGKSC